MRGSRLRCLLAMVGVALVVLALGGGAVAEDTPTSPPPVAPPPPTKTEPPITVILYPPEGAVLNEVGGTIVGFSNRENLYQVLFQLNEGPIQEIDLWDGVFDLDINWAEGENTVLVGTERLNKKISRINSVKRQFSCDTFLDDDQVYSVHQAMLDNCGNCHVLGEAADLGLVAESAGELCEKCHEVVDGKGEHPTVACDTCHVPHTSPVPGLARKDDPANCRTCHPKPLSGTEKEGHHAGNWGRQRCGQCHFKPFGNGGCHACHTEQSAPKVTVHGKLLQRRRCVRCHVPHQEVSPGLVQTCKGCHGDMTSVSAGHADVVAEQCARCHTLHGAASSLAAKPARDACLPCHANLAGEEHLPPLAACGPCHAVHESMTGE